MNVLIGSRKHNTERLYLAIREDYRKLTGSRSGGIRVYTQEYILQQLAAKYYRSPRTIENIVFERV